MGRWVALSICMLLAACSIDWDRLDPALGTSSDGGAGGAKLEGGGGAGQGGDGAGGAGGAPGACGDGEAAGDEQCDDGNLDDGDGCSAQCAVECAGIFDASTFHCYAVVDDLDRTWDEARTACQALGEGFDLVGVSSADEHAFLTTQDEITALIPPSSNSGVIWLGGTDADVEGTWVWVNGERFFPSWVTGEPNDSGTGEDCTVYLLRDGVYGYDDRPCTRESPALCERPPAGR